MEPTGIMLLLWIYIAQSHLNSTLLTLFDFELFHFLFPPISSHSAAFEASRLHPGLSSFLPLNAGPNRTKKKFQHFQVRSVARYYQMHPLPAEHLVFLCDDSVELAISFNALIKFTWKTFNLQYTYESPPPSTAIVLSSFFPCFFFLRNNINQLPICQLQFWVYVNIV